MSDFAVQILRAGRPFDTVCGLLKQFETFVSTGFSCRGAGSSISESDPCVVYGALRCRRLGAFFPAHCWFFQLTAEARRNAELCGCYALCVGCLHAAPLRELFSKLISARLIADVHCHSSQLKPEFQNLSRTFRRALMQCVTMSAGAGSSCHVSARAARSRSILVLCLAQDCSPWFTLSSHNTYLFHAKFPNLLHSLSDAHVADVMCVYAIAGATMASLLLVVAVLALAITSVYAADPDPVKGAATG